ncbi:MAG: DUF418 domain-containing protein [Pseudomonadota bacterium]|nr:DUF418 domain-containing protein [Pseudomonadota bacterium]
MTDTTITPTRERIASLDVIRGVAVMGILAMNIYAFALPGGAYFNPTAFGGSEGLDWLAWAFNFVFVDSKMRGLFSVLFGASMLLVMERAIASSRRPAVAHFTRMAWLLLFGLLHFYLIWWGDILALYALCGMLLFFFRNRSLRALRRWAIGLLTVSFLFMGAQSIGLQMARSDNAPPAQAEEMRPVLTEIEGFFGASAERVREDLVHYRAGYRPIMRERLEDETTKPFASLIQYGLETLGLMLIGMALFKSGMLTGHWEPKRYRRWAMRCFAVATPPLVALMIYQVRSGYDALTVFGVSLAWSMPFDIIMTIGWAALIMLVAGRYAGSRGFDRVGAAGRMAFTNYLTTSIVMTTIFYGYGLGFYGEIGRAALYLFVIGMWAAMLLWSKPWLDRFRYGPFEWAWRSLARLRLEPMRNSAPLGGSPRPTRTTAATVETL